MNQPPDEFARARPAPTLPHAAEARGRALPAPRRRLRAAGLVTALAGAALFVYVVEQAGLEEIARAARRVGWAFAIILALAGLRYLLRALAWVRCAGRGPLPLPSALQAIVIGDALGNLTPLGLLVSEPAKAAFVRPGSAWPDALSALAVENFFYALSAGAVIVAGLLLLPLAVEASGAWGIATAAGALLLAAGALAGHLLLHRRLPLLSGTVARLETHGLFSRALASTRASVEQLEARLFDLYAASRASALALVLLEAGFHAAAVAETYLTLELVTGVPPSLLVAFLFESVNRFLTAAFKFVPLRLGVDEAGTALFAGALAFEPAVGVAVALVRKARLVCWTAAGLLLLTRRGVQSARASP